MTALLEVSGLQTYYGVSHILRGVSFSLAQGESMSLIGRNGMGKTTTLRSICGLTRPRGGVVRFRGEVITNLAPHEIARRGIALVPEGRGIFNNLTVAEHLQMAARPGADGRTDWPIDRVAELFPKLRARWRNWGGQLSGGEQQMLTIGRALTTNPNLLILDEATEGLAPLIRREVWRVIGVVQQSGIAAIVVDKNVQTLLKLTRHAVILVKGEVVHDGAASALAARHDILHQHLGV